jgi:hypothetical protein
MSASRRVKLVGDAQAAGKLGIGFGNLGIAVPSTNSITLHPAPGSAAFEAATSDWRRMAGESNL